MRLPASWSRIVPILLTLAVLLMSSFFLAPVSGVFQAHSSPGDDFAFFTVTLEVKDSGDSAIVGAQVLAFSDDWGIRIPGTLDTSTFLTTDSLGHATFQVSKGTWTFFAIRGESGSCLFLTASLQVQSSTTVSLKPSSAFSVSAYSISGSPIDVDDFRIVDESHAPILPTTSCGTTAAGQISVSVNSQGPFRVLAVRRPSASEGYYLLATNVSPSQDLEIRPTSSSSASVTFQAFGADNSPTSGDVEVRLPDFDINNMVIDFSVAGTATVIFTPMRVVYNFRFFPTGWYLYFSSEAYELTAGSSREIRFGGPLTKQLQVIPHASTGQGGSPTFAPMTQIWLKIADQYGYILISMTTPSGKPGFPFALTQSGNIVFQGSIPQGEPFTLKIPSEYSESASPSYSVSGDLGPFGTFSLNGDLISSETSYQLSTFNSAHFRMAVPAGVGEKTNRITSFMDQLYETAQSMTGQPISGEIQYEVDLMGGGFSWENLPVPTKLLLSMYLNTEPLSPGTLFVTSHEFGHTRTLREPTDIALDFWGESYASLIAIEGISRIYTQKMWLWLTGQHDFFFYHLQGMPVSERSQQIEAAQFVLAYLEKEFGWDIHYRFFSQWSTDLASKAQTLSSNGFQASEVYATLYSFLAGQNLAWIFSAAGLGVTDARVTQGLALILRNRTFAPAVRMSTNTGASEDVSVATTGSRVYVAWSDTTPVTGSGGAAEVWLRASSNGGASFGSATRISTNTGWSLYPSVAAIGSYVYVAWYDYTPVTGSGDNRPEIWMRVSANSGASFGSAIRLSTNAYNSLYPSVAAAGSYVYAAWQDDTPVPGSGEAPEIWIRVSSNNGVTFGSAIRISTNTYDSVSPFVAASGSYVYVAWEEYTPVPGSGAASEVWMRVSSNNGASFGSAVRITTNIGYSEYPSVAAVGNYVYVAWDDNTPVTGSGSSYEVWMRVSSNNGASFGSPIRISTNTSWSLIPSVTASGSYVYVAWEDDTPVAGSGGAAEVWLRVSSNNGASFGSALRISTNAYDSLNPSVAASGSVAYVAWEDYTPVSGSGSAPEIWLRVGS